MAESPWPAQVELSDYLTDIDAVQQKLRIAPPLVVLAGDLLKRVPRRVAVRNASELVSALLVHASQRKPDELGEMVIAYRESQAHQVLDTNATEGPYALPARTDLELT